MTALRLLGDTIADVRGNARSAERTRARTALMMRAGAVGAWLAVGVLALFGDLIHTTLRPDDDAAQTTVIAAMWLAYALVLAALLLPGPRALTVTRIGVPAGALELALAAASLSDPFAVIGHLFCVAGTLIVFHPAYAEAQVDAASYGDERRFLLRPPGPVVVALVVPMGALAVAGVASGPLLLAGRGWAAGIVAAAVGLPAAALAAHTLYRLARRWLVFVPNGLVVHDHLAVAEPLPLGRRSIDSIGPARADTDATDLTAQAFGMALELRLAGPVAAGVMTGRSRSEQRSLTAMLVSPSRPAAVLATAERRGIKID
ncbi:MAG: hypothetical protein F4Z34_11505 [Acidimicrobiaceae bacterium]|nr:hypothetical protein [Acidimicrobiaceae bacterium]